LPYGYYKKMSTNNNNPTTTTTNNNSIIIPLPLLLDREFYQHTNNNQQQKSHNNKKFLSRSLYYRFPTLRRDAFNKNSLYKSGPKPHIIESEKIQEKLLIRSIKLKLFALKVEQFEKGRGNKKNTRRKAHAYISNRSLNSSNFITSLCLTLLGLNGNNELDGDDDNDEDETSSPNNNNSTQQGKTQFVSLHVAIYSLSHDLSTSGYTLRETHHATVPVMYSGTLDPNTSPYELIEFDMDIAVVRGEDTFLVIQVFKLQTNNNNSSNSTVGTTSDKIKWPTHMETLTSNIVGPLTSTCQLCVSARTQAQNVLGVDEPSLVDGTMDGFGQVIQDNDEFDTSSIPDPVLHGVMRLWSPELMNFKSQSYYEFGVKPHPSINVYCTTNGSSSSSSSSSSSLVFDPHNTNTSTTSCFSLCFSLEHCKDKPAYRDRCRHKPVESHHQQQQQRQVESSSAMNNSNNNKKLRLLSTNNIPTTSSNPLRTVQQELNHPLSRWISFNYIERREYLYDLLFNLPIRVQWRFPIITQQDGINNDPTNLFEEHVEQLIDWRCPICNIYCVDLFGICLHGNSSHDKYQWNIVHDNNNNDQQYLDIEYQNNMTTTLQNHHNDQSLHIITFNHHLPKRSRHVRYVNPYRFVRADTFEPLKNGIHDINNDCMAPTPEWWLEKEESKMNEYLDLSREEKSLMLRWNEFLLHNTPTAINHENGKLTVPAVTEFCKLALPHVSRMNLSMLLINLVDFSALTEVDLAQVIKNITYL
jgi:hypothetical protein